MLSLVLSVLVVLLFVGGLACMTIFGPFGDHKKVSTRIGIAALGMVMVGSSLIIGHFLK